MMKAFGVQEYGAPTVIKLLEIEKPKITNPRDILIKMKAIAVNPVDTKVRKQDGKPDGTHRILGWDGSGVVEEVGTECKFYKAGDEVMFAGSITKPGSNAEYCVVDERITGRKPKNVSHEDASALPLTALTAWEGMEEQLFIPIPKDDSENPNKNKAILFTAGAGGVGSIGIQLAKKVFKFGKVIATASRPETYDFCKKMGADIVVDHSKEIGPQLKENGVDGIDYVFECVDTAKYFDQHCSYLKPLGGIVSIVESKEPVKVGQLMGKRGRFAYELMFTRSIHGIDLEKQRDILNNVADLVEKGEIDCRATVKFDNMNKLPDAHQLQETGRAIGKIVISANF